MMQPINLTHGMLNDDGLVDLVIVGLEGVRLQFGAGDGTFHDAGLFPHSGPVAGALLADLDGDGHHDLCLSNVQVITIYRGDGAGGFQEVSSLNAPTWSMMAHDLDVDGHVDLIAADYTTGHALVYFGPLIEPTVHLRISPAPIPRSIVVSDLESPLTLPVGANPRDLLVADLDGNGHLDVAVANEGSNSISIVRGLGGRTFLPKIDFLVGTRPSEIEVGDFNGDGRLDLATAHNPRFTGIGSQDTSILLGDEQALFEPERRIEVLSISSTAGDFEGNGRDDLAIGSFRSLAVLLGDDDEIPGRLPVFVNTGPVVTFELGDFVKDGIPDIAHIAAPSAFLAYFRILPGLGGGRFDATTVNHFVDAFGMSIGDMNNDGFLDALIPADGARLVSLLGDGSGGVHEILSQLPTASISVGLGDFDRDGWTDALQSRFDSDLAFSRGNGDGTFETAVIVATGVAAASDIKVGDLNDDGKLDGVVVSGTHPSGPRSLFPIVGAGDGTFQATIPIEMSSPTRIHLDDVNNDGLADILAARLALGFGPGSIPGQVGPFLGRGDGSFEDQVILDESEFSFTDVTSGDFNADGLVDIAAIVAEPSRRSSVLVFYGASSGAFSVGQRHILDGEGPRNIRAGDLNQDRRVDLVVSTLHSVGFNLDPNSGLFVLLNEGPFPNEPPIASVTGPSTVECSVPGGSVVQLDGSSSSDPDSTMGTNDDIVLFEWFADGGSSDDPLLGVGEIIEVQLPLGVHHVRLLVTDAEGESSYDDVTIEVKDTTPPLVTASIVRYLPGHGGGDLADTGVLQGWGHGARDDDDDGGGHDDDDDGHGDDDDDGGGHDDDDGHGDDDDDDDGGKRYVIRFGATDLCDPSASASARLHAEGCSMAPVVTDGQVIAFTDTGGRCDIQTRRGVLDFEASAITLRVAGVDESGNQALSEATVGRQRHSRKPHMGMGPAQAGGSLPAKPANSAAPRKGRSR